MTKKERLRRHFTDAQLVELTARSALRSFWNKFNDALGLETEPGLIEMPSRNRPPIRVERALPIAGRPT